MPLLTRTLAVIAIVAVALLGSGGLVASADSLGTAQIKYKINPTVRAQVIPNYLTGFGPVGGLGSGQTPAVGAGAVLGGGTVDFGNVVVGYQYLYKYAAQINVQTNDSAGFVVYGEGATDLNGSNPVPSPATFPLAQTLFWLISNSANSSFSPARTFNRTAGNPIAGGAGGIDYSATGGQPAPMAVIWSYPASGSISQGYDYQLRLSGAMAASQFNVYIVYTVVGN